MFLMGRSTIFFPVLMLCSLLSASVFFPMFQVESTREVRYQIMESVEADLEKYSMRVDKRIELLTAVQLFTSWRKTGLWGLSYPYKEDMLEFFETCSNHEAVTLCEKLISSGFSYGAPVSFMMCLSDPPELDVVIPFSEHHVSSAGLTAILEEFVEALRSFCLESRFEDFWIGHQDFYANVERRAYNDIPLESTVKTLEDYFGTKQHAYHVILAPLRLGNYAYWIKVNDSSIIYAFLGPQKIDRGIPVDFGGALFHEFAHSFVNPLTEEFSQAYKNPWRLYEPIENRMTSMGYGGWGGMIDEHIIRAVEIKVYKKKELTSSLVLSTERYLDYEETSGFIYIKPLFDLLSEYDRDSYRSFREFYPEIVELFNAIAVEHDLVVRVANEKGPTPFIETPLGTAIMYGLIIGVGGAIIMAVLFEMRRKLR